MREADAVYGGEMSAHHYFKTFAYCDNGNIPWLLVAELISVSGQKLSAMVADRVAKFPCSGEINRTVNDPVAIITAIEKFFLDDVVVHERVDGLSMAFDDWRFNLRMSSTEPVLRLNVESRADNALVVSKTELMLGLIEEYDPKS